MPTNTTPESSQPFTSQSQLSNTQETTSDVFKTPPSGFASFWTGFLRGTQKHKKTNRFRAKCSYCSMVMDGRGENLQKHMRDCAIATPKEKSEYIALNVGSVLLSS